MIPIKKLHAICQIKTEDTPFLSKWIEKFFQNEIFPEESGVPRKGRPKQGRKPLSKERKLFCLGKAFNDDLKLKNYAEEFDQNYVVVRRWNNDPQIKKYISDLREQFADSFIKKIYEILKDYDYVVKSGSDKNAQIAYTRAKHTSECINYDLILTHTIEDFLLKKIETLPDNQKAHWLNIYTGLPSGLADSRILHSAKSKKSKDLLTEEAIRYFPDKQKTADNLFLEMIKNEIKKGEISSAIALLDNLERMMNFRTDETANLRVSIINNGKKQG